MEIVVENWLPPSFNGRRGLLRTHWAVRKRAFLDAQLLLRAALGPPPWRSFNEPVQVTMTRVRPRGTAMDRDNADASFKLVGDALQALGVLSNDRIIGKLDVRQEKGAKKTVVRIEPLPPPPSSSP